VLKELEVTIRIRNNRLKERREKLGYSQTEMAMVIGIPKVIYARYECMSYSPIRKSGEWAPQALMVAEYFDCDVEELFPPSVLKIVSPSTTKKFDGAELHLLMSAHSQEGAGGYEQRLLAAGEEESTLFLARKAVARLKPLEAEVIKARFGMDDCKVKNYGQLAEGSGVSAGRMFQIGKWAMHKIREEIFQSTSGDNRFVFCFLDIFEEGEVARLRVKLKEELNKVFPGVPLAGSMRSWLPGQVEVRVYGFLQEGLPEVQAQVDEITRSVFASEKWKLRGEAKSEPVEPKKIKRERAVVEIVLSEGNPTERRIQSFVMKVVQAAVDSPPRLVLAKCDSLVDGRLVADHLFIAARLNFGCQLGCRSTYNPKTRRSVMELDNGSTIDLVCDEVERYNQEHFGSP
jgi:transcriptional regulator with XRE-family HTH domain